MQDCSTSPLDCARHTDEMVSNDAIVSVASLLVSAGSLLVAFIAAVLTYVEGKRRKDADAKKVLRDWLTEMANTTAMYDVEQFKRRCGADGLVYTTVFQVHNPTHRITADDLARAEQARTKLAGMWEAIRRDCTDGRMPANDLRSEGLLLNRTINYLVVVEMLEAANLIRIAGPAADYAGHRPGRFRWIQRQVDATHERHAEVEAHKAALAAYLGVGPAALG